MALSSTYDFDPTLGDLTIQAFHMCGIRPAALLQEHLVSARMAANLMLGRWSSMGVNTWSVDLQTITLVQGQKTYSVPSDTITLLDAYTVQDGGTAADTNSIITSVSRSEYASYSNPDTEGRVTTFWFNRQLDPTITFYLVPDGTQTEVQYYRLRQSMDANLASGGNVELPYYWLEAFVTGLAARLAVIWAPDRAQGLKLLADESYKIASDQNVERANVYISPALQNYWVP